MSLTRRSIVPLAFVLVFSTLPVLAEPDVELDIRLDDEQGITWDPAAGVVGYHVYSGLLSGLPDNGTCLIANRLTESATVTDTPAPGEGFFYLVSAFDETGEGPVGDKTTGPRSTLDNCVPARRYFASTPDGDPGDGVIDGDFPLRNSSAISRDMRNGDQGVLLHTGEFYAVATDMTIAGRHMDFVFRRTYRSQVAHDGPLGHNWEFNLGARLSPLGIDVVHHDGTGRQETFGRIDSTHFTSPRGQYSVLTEQGDGSFILRSPQGELRTFNGFDGSNVQGALLSIEDRFGDRITLQYVQGLLTTVTDSLGRRVDFSYDAAGRITSFTDFDGRSWVYTYDANGDLVSARSPVVLSTPNGNDFPSGKLTQYTYASGMPDPKLDHDMLTMIRPNEMGSGIPWMQIGYYGTAAPAFDVGRVQNWTIGGTNASGVPAGGTMSLSYLSLNPGGNPNDLALPRRETTVTDRAGNLREFVHNFPGNRISETFFTNRNVRPGEGDYTSTCTYNADGEKLVETLPAGNEIRHVYDTPGLDRYREGNLLELRRVADTARGDGHGSPAINDLVTTYAYEPVYNLVATVTDPRGNDASYVPQNGGLQSADRYTTEWTYDHQEGDPATTGLNAYASAFDIDLTGFAGNLGDINNDTDTSGVLGNLVRRVEPEVRLDPASNQAAIEGDTSQDAVSLHEYNAFGQRIRTTDPEGNVHLFVYHPENDPDGDGTPTPTPPDGRSLDGSDGGYVQSVRLDTASGAGRNNGLDPPPVDAETTYEYDEVGHVTRAVDGRGVATVRIYNALDQVVELRRAAATADASGPGGDPPTGRGELGLTAFGFFVHYFYDANDNPTDRKVEDRGSDRGAGTTVDDCLIWDIVDTNVEHEREVNTTVTLVTQFRYDANENLSQVTEPEGNVHLTVYDERDLVFQTTTGAAGPRGGTPSAVTFAYDANGNVASTTDGRAHPIDFIHDGFDRHTRLVDQLGNTQDWFWDPASDLVRELSRGPIGGPPPADRLGTGNVDLSEFLHNYDERGRLFRTDRALFVPAGAAPVRSPVITDGPLSPGDGFVNTVFEFDRNSRPTFVIRDTGETERTDYDGAGRTIQTTDPDGSTVELTWDDQNNVIEIVETDLPSVAGPPPELFLTTHFHDALGRLTRSVDNLGQTTHQIHDSLDAVIVTSDPNGPPGPTINRRSPAHAALTVQTNNHGNVRRRGWDAADRPTFIEDTLTLTGLGDGTPNPPPDTSNPANPDGLITTIYGWDGNSLLDFVQDDNGNATTRAHDNMNRVVAVTQDDLTQETYAYDAEHNLIQRVDANGSTTTHTYDDANRLTRTDVARAPNVEGTTLQTFENDGLDRVTLATDDNDPTDTTDDATVTIIRDSLGRTIEEQQTFGIGGGATKVIDLQWNADIQPTAVIYPSGYQTQHAYDAPGRLTSTTDGARAATRSYYGMGREIEINHGNGTRTTMLDNAGTADIGYDGRKRIVKMRHIDPLNAVLGDFEHTWDRASRRVSEVRGHHAEPGGVRGELWRHDSGRAIQVVEGTLDPTLSLVGPPVDDQQWLLDGVNNWVQMNRLGVPFDFTPNNLNEYDEPQAGGTRVDDGVPDDVHDPSGPPADGQNRAHDKNGNRTDDGIRQYFLDFRNRPVRIHDPAGGGDIATYKWGPFDRRMFRQVQFLGPLDETERYLYMPAMPDTGSAAKFKPARTFKEPVAAGGAAVFPTWVGTQQFARMNKSELIDKVASAADPTWRPPIAVFGPRVIESRDNTDNVVQQIAYGPELPVWQIDGTTGQSQYLHHDPRGNVVMLTDGAAPNVLERVTFDVYGKPLFQDQNNVEKTDLFGNFLAVSDFDNSLLFTSWWYDPETGNRSNNFLNDFGGLYVNGGRWLDPDDGRYITRVGDLFPIYDPSGASPVTNNGRSTVRPHDLMAIRFDLAGSPFKVDDDWSKTTGERLTATPTIYAGTAYFTTYTPQGDVPICGVSGFSKIYGIHFNDACTTIDPTPTPRLPVDPNTVPITYCEDLEQEPGTVVFGVAVTQQPICHQTQEFTDNYVGSHVGITSSKPPSYTLVLQTGAKPAGAKTETRKLPSPAPKDVPRLSSWGSIIE